MVTGLKPGTVGVVEFTDLLANGQAVGRFDGMVVFVDGPLPGERARIRLTDVKAKYAVGQVLERETTSPDRAEPFCPVFGTCGGCQVQHLAYPAQLAWKHRIVADALVRIGGFHDLTVREPIGMDVPRAYRNKMALVVEEAGPAPVFGFYRARSHDLVPIDHCPIVLEPLDAAIGGLLAAARAPETAAAFSAVKHVVMRAGLSSPNSVLSLTTDAKSPAIAAAAPQIAERIPGIGGISNSYEPANANAVIGRRMDFVWGRREMEETIEGVRFRVSPASFFQINGAMVASIFRTLAPLIAGTPRIVDLYCGAGTFAIYFASRGASVVGIEENAAAVTEARGNARLNKVEERVRFVQGRVEGALANAEGRTALREAEIVFLDPPRKGSDEATLAAIAEARVPSIWYLSCNPATLARDLRYLAGRGYGIGLVQPFDMFPQTGHVETLVTLTTGSAPGPGRN
ncbi:MAG: 23S rRNA (uracil(1939)-C(5))-methyltransferase RlmD [Candidatus Lustribacter sp.]|jgi:23S rRNA (uracil1939-C5)-methyltransferase